MFLFHYDRNLASCLSLLISEIRGRVGTTECMAPEVVKEELYGIGSDLWSLGILLYEMYFKETPFADDTPDAIEYKI
ncbi:hypothetical protein H312_01821, partial [Anncaliia algerae PRA339]